MNKHVRWTKVDFHHHTSSDKTRKKSDLDKDKMLKAYLENDCSLFVLSNHGQISIDDYFYYKEKIDTERHDINVLPGIELRYKLDNESIGHLILIFDELSKEVLNKLNKLFNNEEIYSEKDNQAKLFSDFFPALISKIKEITGSVIVMPHFSKSNQIDHESLGGNSRRTSEWLYSFDFLEGAVGNMKSFKAIQDSMDMSHLSEDKAISSGTDAQDMKSFNSDLSKLFYYLITNDFNGLLDLSRFHSNRTSKAKKEIATKYIKSLNIDRKEIKFDIGLNTIIGRRGSGKSVLLREINDFILKKSDKNLINISNDDFHIDPNKVLYLSQDELSKDIGSFIENLYHDKKGKFDLISSYFNGKSRTDFLNPIVEFNKIKKTFCGQIFSLLKNTLTKVNEKHTSIIKAKIFTLLTSFKDSISKYENEDQIRKIEDDTQIIDNIELEKGSPWLKHKIKEIKTTLNSIKDNEKYKRSQLVDNIIREINQYNNNLSEENRMVNILKTIKDNNDSLKTIDIKNKFDNLMEIPKAILKMYSDMEDKKLYVIQPTMLNKKDFLTSEEIITDFNGVSNADGLFNLLKTISYNSKNEKLTNTKSEGTIRDFYTTKKISRINGKDISDNSIGENHQMFIDSALKLNDKEIILLDQPDDDLDSITIQETIIRRINENSDSKQWIVVTHDPKIVINSDSRSIILANYKNSSQKGLDTYLNIDREKLREFGYKILDAKKEYPAIRSKIYKGDNHE